MFWYLLGTYQFHLEVIFQTMLNVQTGPEQSANFCFGI